MVIALSRFHKSIVKFCPAIFKTTILLLDVRLFLIFESLGAGMTAKIVPYFSLLV